MNVTESTTAAELDVLADEIAAYRRDLYATPADDLKDFPQSNREARERAMRLVLFHSGRTDRLLGLDEQVDDNGLHKNGPCAIRTRSNIFIVAENNGGTSFTVLPLAEVVAV